MKGISFSWDVSRPEFPQAVSASADSRLRIPIRPRLRSLNVGIAATIAVTEALRQLDRLPSMIEQTGEA